MTSVGPKIAAVATAIAASTAGRTSVAAGSPDEIVYRIDAARSAVTFQMRATLHTVEGRTSELSGALTLPRLPAPDGFPVGGKIVIAAATLDTGNRKRDRRMRSESLNVERFPEITFRPVRAVGRAISLDPGTAAAFSLQGELTVRDATRPVTISVTARFTEEEFTAEGSTVISFPDYGVPDPSGFFLRVDPRLVIRIELAARAVRQGRGP